MEICPLEQHVLEQMSHSRFAITLVTGSYKNRAVDRHLGLTLVCKEQNFESIVKGVFRNSFNSTRLGWHLIVRESVSKNEKKAHQHPKDSGADSRNSP
jgi:hypothetical protein